MAGYHFGVRPALPGDRSRGIEDVRWALLALEPGGMRYGAFTASDGADVPYRLWLTPQPRAAGSSGTSRSSPR